MRNEEELASAGREIRVMSYGRESVRFETPILPYAVEGGSREKGEECKSSGNGGFRHGNQLQACFRRCYQLFLVKRKRVRAELNRANDVRLAMKKLAYIHAYVHLQLVYTSMDLLILNT